MANTFVIIKGVATIAVACIVSKPGAIVLTTTTAKSDLESDASNAILIALRPTAMEHDCLIRGVVAKLAQVPLVNARVLQAHQLHLFVVFPTNCLNKVVSDSFILFTIT
jgi:hypothetical protein